MDETRKAASVAQLQELNARVERRLEAIEQRVAEEPETPDIGSAVLGVQQLLDAKLTAAVAEIKAMQGPDLTPILVALQDQGAKISDLMATVALLTQTLMAPVERTGTAQLSDGTSVNIHLTDRKMQ